MTPPHTPCRFCRPRADDRVSIRIMIDEAFRAARQAELDRLMKKCAKKGCWYDPTPH